jgi:hypothetical protein
MVAQLVTHTSLRVAAMATIEDLTRQLIEYMAQNVLTIKASFTVVESHKHTSMSIIWPDLHN